MKTKLIACVLAMSACSLGAQPQDQMLKCNVISETAEIGQQLLDSGSPPEAMEILIGSIMENISFRPSARYWAVQGIVRGYNSIPQADHRIMKLKAFDDCMEGKFD
jgi:hypothetical protein